MKMHQCYICRNDTEDSCRECEQWVCEDCQVPYTQFNFIDYTLCESCYENRRDLKGSQALRDGFAEYNQTTGEWQWKSVNEMRKEQG